MLFDEVEPTEEEKITSAIERLVSLGYVVLPPNTLDHKSVNSAADLVNYFYSLLQFYNQGRKLHYTASTKRDIKHAMAFIKRRKEESGEGAKRAIAECAEIVHCVIRHEDKFKFSEPLHSFDVFGQDENKWVTDRAISIINNENEEHDKEELGILMDGLYVEQELESLSLLDSNVEKLKLILGGLDDGKKE